MLLDPERLGAVDATAFQRREPYPWVSLAGTVTDAAFRELREALPPVTQMTPSFGRRRAHGQQPHDRYSLEYRPDLAVDAVWHRLVAELEGPVYREWLARLLGSRRFRLSFHWHYAPRGCSVSPHCDARRKLGSHIFYLNTRDDWDASWGGQTQILDDGGRFRRDSAPGFHDFPRRWTGPSLGNYSLLFQRRGNSWHGVEPLTCPEGYLRKVFIVVINADGMLPKLARALETRHRRRRA